VNGAKFLWGACPRGSIGSFTKGKAKIISGGNTIAI
tara:strand:- start:132 stop:239 length:108 start_codon:yes stop_codon:yes gene_type:complete